jgi:predicted enzyme related to lactoylglutathione lyase
MSRPVHFEIPAKNPEKTAEFYTKAFGWRIKKWEGPIEYWLITTGEDSEPGINGGLLRRTDPQQQCVNTVGVADVDKAVETIVKLGGTIMVPKMPIPGMGWLAYCNDPEGNAFGVMQPDETAK